MEIDGAYLAGFIEADGGFNVILREKGYRLGRVVCQFYLAQRMEDKRGGSLYEILK